MAQFDLKDLIVGSKILLRCVGYCRNHEIDEIIPATVIEHSNTRYDGDITKFKIVATEHIVTIVHDYSRSTLIETYKLAE